MSLNQTQRALLLLGMALAIALLPLVGGLHHHDHDDGASEVCWYCMTASASTLPLGISLVALAVAWAPFRDAGLSAPAHFLWMSRHRRGPPSISLA